eukprot:140335_1
MVKILILSFTSLLCAISLTIPMTDHQTNSYIGCYRSGRSDRSFTYDAGDYTDYDECAAICHSANFDYVAIKGMKRCLCGDYSSLERAKKHGVLTRCSDDGTGGFEALSIYDIGGEINALEAQIEQKIQELENLVGCEIIWDYKCHYDSFEETPTPTTGAPTPEPTMWPTIKCPPSFDHRKCLIYKDDGMCESSEPRFREYMEKNCAFECHFCGYMRRYGIAPPLIRHDEETHTPTTTTTSPTPEPTMWPTIKCPPSFDQRKCLIYKDDGMCESSEPRFNAGQCESSEPREREYMEKNCAFECHFCGYMRRYAPPLIRHDEETHTPTTTTTTVPLK